MTADRTEAGRLEVPGPPEGQAAWHAVSLQDEVIRQSVDAIVVTDADLRVRVWNPAAERLYGIPAATAIGQSMAELVVTSDTTGEVIDGEAALAELAASGIWRRRIIQRPRTGPLSQENVVIDTIVTLLRGSDGTTVGALGVNRDVTASALLESELAALGSLVVATGRARTMAEVAQAALEILCRTTGAEAGLVTSAGPTYEATAHLGIHQATIDAVVSYGQLDGPLARALKTPDSVVSADVVSAPIREDVRAAVIADGIEHLLVVGLRLSGRLTGILALGWRKRAPREPSRAIIQQAAALVTAAMENARLLTAVESGLNEERLLTRRMRALVELTRLPETTASSGSGIDRLMIEIATVIGADGSVFGEVEGDRLALREVDRIEWTEAEPLVNRPLLSIPVASSLASGSAAVLFSLSERPTTPEGTAAGMGLGFLSGAAFAVRDVRRLSGILFALFRRPVEALEIDERTLDAIGRVLDISIANQRLREDIVAGERRYRDLFEASPDALLVEGSETVIDANSAARKLFGDEIVGRAVMDLFVADREVIDRETLGPDGISGLLGTGRRLDGSTFPEEVDLRPIEIAGQRRMLAIVRDLTERTRMQGELIQAQKMDAIGFLVAGVAHELNNPLTAIVGFSHLLRTDPNLPADLRSHADLLVQEANRTKGIVQNLLDFARLRPPERVEMELRPLIDSVLGLQSYVLSRTDLTVAVDLAPDLPRIWVDRAQMQQVLINLTVNATQAIRSVDRPGTIRIRSRSARNHDGPTVRIEIADDGPGVPPAIIDRLFMPFVTTKEPGAGTGLGLSVSFGIVASHGGTLRHERNAEGGATFIIELPVERDEAGRAGSTSRATKTAAATSGAGTSGAATSEAAAAAPAPATPTARPLRVLVLDDEPSIRDFLGRVLERNGYEPILADTGALALEIVRTDPPDAILCDHRMAGMSGTEFHAAVMQVAPRLASRFAFMSGDVLNPELREFAEARGVHLLAKPFDIAAVASIVASLVANGPG
ncbi:MAG TPA: PAS domain S-box protein [Candidatus Limnocylindrales bacterium]|nr:PAS domain S-box protein [Candidatus Limnocylindrales bacterium]